MGDQGQGATGQLLRVTDPSLHHPGRVVQWRGDLCPFQEPSPHGEYPVLNCLVSPFNPHFQLDKFAIYI